MVDTLAKLFVATWAIIAVWLFGAAALIWIRRKTAVLRGRHLPRLRIF